MGFLSPMQLAWVATIAIVILLYVRWAARKTFPTTTLPIWEHALARRTPWSRWRRTVSILAACVPIVLLAIALAQPFLAGAVEGTRTIVVVVDNTASMNAQPRGESRLAQAKREARRLIRNLRTHDRMAILSADSSVRVRCGLTGDRTALHLALDEVQPTDGTGAMNDCIETARRLVQDEPRPVVVVISDGSFEAGEAASGDEVVGIVVGQDADNLAITRIAARPSLGDGRTQQVLIEVANFGESPASASVALKLGEEALPTEKIDIPTHSTVQRVVEVAVQAPILLIATLDADDALAADNTASLLLSPQPATNVVLVSQKVESPLETALRSLSHVTLTKTATPSIDLEADAILVFDEAAVDPLPDRAALIFRPSSSSEFWTVRGEIRQPQAAPSHPLLADVELRDVIIDEAVDLQLGGNANAILETTSGQPLISTISRPAGDLVVVSFGTQESDFALHDDFPNFLTNALSFLAGPPTATSSAWQTTDTLVLSEHHSGDKLTSPYGESFPVGANVHAVGLWRVESDDQNRVALLPVNLADAAESDLEARWMSPRKGWPHLILLPDLGRLWMPLVALALVWVAAHWASYQRRTID